MGKHAPHNVHCLLELIERAPRPVLQAFFTLPACQAPVEDFDWNTEESNLTDGLIGRIARMRKDQRDQAEREAMRILRLTSARGMAVLAAVADQLNDEDLIGTFHFQEGAELGRAVWMRTYSAASARLFDVAEAIVNTGDLRGSKRLHDAFDLPCEEAPPFLWNPAIRTALERHLSAALRLAQPCEVVHVPLCDENGVGGFKLLHYLVARFAGDQVSALEVVDANRRSFCYYPARDATLVYDPNRRVVEVYAHTLASRAPLANALAQHGFAAPLSNRPLNRARYDLSRFARPLLDERPRVEGATVERLYLIEAQALLECAPHTVSLQVHNGAELHDVIGNRWGNHPFAEPESIVGVTLGADLLFDGDATPTQLSIVLAEPGRCSLAGERDRRVRQAGMQLLEALGVFKPLQPGSGVDSPALLAQVCKLLERAGHLMDGFALTRLGIDIDKFEEEGILTEGERIADTLVESAEGERFRVRLERCADASQVRYRDPFTGRDVSLPAKHARRWRIHLAWLREELVTALGEALRGVRSRGIEREPVYLGEVEIDGRSVATYFATRMATERHYAEVDAALRLRPRTVPGVVLTTTSKPFRFAGTNVVVPIEDVLARAGEKSVVDMAQLAMIYRDGQLAARGGVAVNLRVSEDGRSAVLGLPGKAPWQVTGKARVSVLQRLVDAHVLGAPHVVTKKLMEDTGCTSPGNLFPKTSPWRDYVVRTDGSSAWQLNLAACPASIVGASDAAANDADESDKPAIAG